MITPNTPISATIIVGLGPCASCSEFVDINIFGVGEGETVDVGIGDGNNGARGGAYACVAEAVPRARRSPAQIRSRANMTTAITHITLRGIATSSFEGYTVRCVSDTCASRSIAWVREK